MAVDLYRFYIEGGRQIDSKWTTREKALEHAEVLCDEMGVSIEVARGQELDLVAVYDPEE